MNLFCIWLVSNQSITPAALTIHWSEKYWCKLLLDVIDVKQSDCDSMKTSNLKIKYLNCKLLKRFVELQDQNSPCHVNYKSVDETIWVRNILICDCTILRFRCLCLNNWSSIIENVVLKELLSSGQCPQHWLMNYSAIIDWVHLRQKQWINI